MKVKKITLILALFMVLVCCLGAVSAAEDAGSDVAASDDVAVDEVVGEIDSNNDESISANEQADNVDDSNSALSAQQNNDTSSEPILEEQNNQEPLKSGTNIVNVNNYNGLVTAIQTAVNDQDNNICIINLQGTSYTTGTTNVILNSGTCKPNIIINGNGVTLGKSSFTIQFKTGCNVTFNNTIINLKITNYDTLILNNNTQLKQAATNNGNLFISDSTLNAAITNNNNLTILDGNTFGNNFLIKGSGSIAFNDVGVLPYISEYNGNYILENITITKTKTNNGNLTIRNSTISNKITNNGNLTISDSTMNAQIVNNGILTIADDAIFGTSFSLSGEGQIIINDPNRIAPYLSVYNGVYVIENADLTTAKTNNGNVTIRKSTITAKFTNNGNLTIENSTANSNIVNNGILTIADDVVFGNSFMITGNGKIIINDPNRIALLTERLDGNITLANADLTNFKRTNYGNLTIINSTVKNIDNYGTITFKNSTITGTVNNMIGATLIFEDDVIFGNNVVLSINPESTLIINDTSKIVPYLSVYNGNYIIENQNIKAYSKTNNGNLTIRNSTINVALTNNGNLTIINSTILNSLFNYGNVTIINSTVTMSSGYLNSDVKMIIINSTISVRESTNNGDFDIINSTFTLTNKGLTNTGNVFMDNSTLTSFSQSNNNRKMTVKNSIIDTSLQNTGTLIIEGNTTFTKVINGEGTIIAEDINKYFNKIGVFTGETVIEVGNYTRSIFNSGNLTIENSTINSEFSYLTSENRDNGRLILINTTVNYNWANSGVMELYNVTINSVITNTGILIISEDTIVGENFKITGDGKVLTNNTQLIDFVETYTGNIVLNNKTITDNKTNKGTLTLINCTIDSTIKNDGIINIADDVIFGQNAKITGEGEIVTNDITRLLPIIDAINGNYVINDAVLNKTYIFDGIVTLNNCTITNPDNINYGMLTLKNCTVDVGADNTFLTNFGTVTISKDTKITGKIDDLVEGVIYEGAPKTWIVNNKTIDIFFGIDGYLTSRVNPGDTLDFRGTIRPPHSLIINKAVNIISSTKDAYIDLDSHAGSYFGENPGACFSITKDGAYTNVTGIYFHNTQVWIYNTHHVTLDSISVVVENQRIGSGVGVTSIRQNSSYITVKNSYFHTTENEGSSTLVLAWADYCTIENNTIEGDGMVGNLLYLTTYNVANLPLDIVYNSHNKLINNRIRGPDTAAAICYGICISGYDNLVDNNTITYSGSGIAFQWGSGVDGIEQDECLFGSGENVVSNNKLYGGCGIGAGDIIYNNYMEGTLSVASAKAYNNTANALQIRDEGAEITNNTIYGDVKYNVKAKNSVLENNTIKGDIEIPSAVTGVTINGNDISGSIILDGSNNKISNNKITTTGEYAVYSNKLGKNNNLTDNYMVANGKVGADAVSLRDESNTITDSTLATVIVLSAPSESVVNKSVQVTIKLMDKNGNAVKAAQVTVTSSAGSETVNLTDGTGIYQYTPTAIGEDTVTVKYLGNDSFYPSTNSTKINVTAEKTTPVNPNQTGDNNTKPTNPTTPTKVTKKATKITAKNKKFKAKTKVKKYTIALKAGKKAVKKVQVTIKIGKKTYKAKTNAKGKATFKIKKLTKKGKYNAVIKFKGDKNYKASSKKVKITIK